METEPDRRESEPEATDVVATHAVSPSLRQVLVRGFHATNATPLASALVFALFGPQQIAGAAVAVLVARTNFQPTPGQPFPREFIAMSLLGFGSCVGMFVLLFAYPWVLGAAAGRLRDRVVPPERTVSYTDHGNRFYGRFMVLMLLFGGLVIALVLPTIAMAQLVAHWQGYDPMTTDVESIAAVKHHPALIATGVACGLATAAVGLVWNLCNAATVIEDQSFIGAVRQGVTLLRDRPADGARLYLLALLMNAPVYLLQQLLSERAEFLFVGVMTLIAVYVSYTTILNLSFAVSLYLARRPASLMP